MSILHDKILSLYFDKYDMAKPRRLRPLIPQAHIDAQRGVAERAAQKDAEWGDPPTISADELEQIRLEAADSAHVMRRQNETAAKAAIATEHGPGVCFDPPYEG